MQILVLDELMELLKARDLALCLRDLHEHKSRCGERYRWSLASREGLVRKGPDTDWVDGPNSLPTKDFIDAILKDLKKLHSLCEELGWTAAADKIDMTYGYLKQCPDGYCDWSSLESDFRNITDMVVTDLGRAKLAVIKKDFYDYANTDHLISSDFPSKFPKASEDVREAGNCIAVDCGTAAVFHLMRSIEWGMRALCVDIGMLETRYRNGTVPIEYSQWEQILNQLPDKIEEKLSTFPRGPERQEMQEFYFGLHFDIKPQ